MINTPITFRQLKRQKIADITIDVAIHAIFSITVAISGNVDKDPFFKELVPPEELDDFLRQKLIKNYGENSAEYKQYLSFSRRNLSYLLFFSQEWHKNITRMVYIISLIREITYLWANPTFHILDAEHAEQLRQWREDRLSGYTFDEIQGFFIDIYSNKVPFSNFYEVASIYIKRLHLPSCEALDSINQLYKGHIRNYNAFVDIFKNAIQKHGRDHTDDKTRALQGLQKIEEKDQRADELESQFFELMEQILENALKHNRDDNKKLYYQRLEEDKKYVSETPLEDIDLKKVMAKSLREKMGIALQAEKLLPLLNQMYLNHL